MSNDEDSTQNQNFTENTSPISPVEPTADALIPSTDSEPSTMPLEAPESPREGVDAIPVSNDNVVQKEPEAVKPETGVAPEMPENQASSSSAESESYEADDRTIYIKVNKRQQKNSSSVSTLFSPVFT